MFSGLFFKKEDFHQEFKTGDWYLVAYLSLKEVYPKQYDKAMFVFDQTESLTKCMHEYYDNAQVNVLYFCNHYRTVSSKMRIERNKNALLKNNSAA